MYDPYIAASPIVFWGDFDLIKRAEVFFSEPKELNATLFMTLGDEHPWTIDGYPRMVPILEQQKVRGFKCAHKVMNDEDRNSIVLRSNYWGLRTIFDFWHPSQAVLDGGLADVIAHYKNVSTRMGYASRRWPGMWSTTQALPMCAIAWARPMKERVSQRRPVAATRKRSPWVRRATILASVLFN